MDEHNKTGFEWGVQKTNEDAWNEKFSLLQEFKKANGHCDVPHNTMALRKCVASQRSAYKSDKVGPEKLAILEEVGFNWVEAHFKLHVF